MLKKPFALNSIIGSILREVSKVDIEFAYIQKQAWNQYAIDSTFNKYRLQENLLHLCEVRMAMSVVRCNPSLWISLFVFIFSFGKKRALSKYYFASEDEKSRAFPLEIVLRRTGNGYWNWFQTLNNGR